MVNAGEILLVGEIGGSVVGYLNEKKFKSESVGEVGDVVQQLPCSVNSLGRAVGVQSENDGGFDIWWGARERSGA